MALTDHVQGSFAHVRTFLHVGVPEDQAADLIAHDRRGCQQIHAFHACNFPDQLGPLAAGSSLCVIPSIGHAETALASSMSMQSIFLIHADVRLSGIPHGKSRETTTVVSPAHAADQGKKEVELTRNACTGP